MPRLTCFSGQKRPTVENEERENARGKIERKAAAWLSVSQEQRVILAVICMEGENCLLWAVLPSQPAEGSASRWCFLWSLHPTFRPLSLSYQCRQREPWGVQIKRWLAAQSWQSAQKWGLVEQKVCRWGKETRQGSMRCWRNDGNRHRERTVGWKHQRYCAGVLIEGSYFRKWPLHFSLTQHCIFAFLSGRI